MQRLSQSACYRLALTPPTCLRRWAPSPTASRPPSLSAAPCSREPATHGKLPFSLIYSPHEDRRSVIAFQTSIAAIRHHATCHDLRDGDSLLGAIATARRGISKAQRTFHPPRHPSSRPDRSATTRYRHCAKPQCVGFVRTSIQECRVALLVDQAGHGVAVHRDLS